MTSLFVSLLGMELAARFLEPAAGDDGRARSQEPELTYDERRRPSAEGVFKGQPFRTNRRGFRGPDWDAHPEPGVFRIAITGDSVTMGSGAREEDAYAAQLESLLIAEPLGVSTRFEVLNLGFGGLNAEWVIERLEQAGRAYRFQLAVYGWTPNDIQGPSYRKGPESHVWEDHWKEVGRFQHSRSHLLRSLWPRWQSLRNRIHPVQDGHIEETRANYFENPRAWRAFEASLDHFARFTKQRGICGVVFLHPQEADLEDVHELVAGAAIARGLSVVEALPAFRGRTPEDLWVSIYDAHPNAEGHRLLARALRDGLAKNLPESCWEERIELELWD
jgi:lysophospholipase L1-like esterase